MDSGVHPSLHSYCHHQINHAKVFYPPYYERTVWHLSRAYNLFDWESSLNNHDDNELFLMKQL